MVCLEGMVVWQTDKMWPIVAAAMRLLFIEVYERSLKRKCRLALSKQVTHYGERSYFPNCNLPSTGYHYPPNANEVRRKVCGLDPNNRHKYPNRIFEIQ